MFEKSLCSGLTEYQIEYVKKHNKEGSNAYATRVVVWMNKLVLLVTVFGLWSCVLQPETTHEAVENMALFGVFVLVFMHIFVFLLILLSLVCVMAEEWISEDSDLLIDAKKMMSNRSILHVFCTSYGSRLGLLLWRAVILVFFVGMVAHGYIFAPLVVVTTTILCMWFIGLMKKRVVKFVMELTSERVTELEAAFHLAEDAKDGVSDVE